MEDVAKSDVSLSLPWTLFVAPATQTDAARDFLLWEETGNFGAPAPLALN